MSISLTKTTVLLLVSLGPFAESYATGGQHYVSRRYYCSSADKVDAGDQTISADGPSCAASRQAINETASRSGDVCRAFDQDWSFNGRSEEIQASGTCPRQ